MSIQKLTGDWYHIEAVENKSFTCGHCNEKVSSNQAYRLRVGASYIPLIYICHACNKPVTFTPEQKPSPALGHSVAKLPDDIGNLYEEIRRATSVNAYTSAVMAARKLLMHIAVEKGAKENLKFIQYVDYLEDQHYTPPNSKKWVDNIRTLGNDANHEIKLMDSIQAERILTFLEMLMKFIYEFPDEPENEEIPVA